MHSILLSGMMDACRNAGDFQLEHLRTLTTDSISDKGLNQLVSFVDVESEKMLVQYLKKLRPDAGFITEENTAPNDSESHSVWIIDPLDGTTAPNDSESHSVWIIDPLDGTTNFLHGLQVFSISIALMENKIVTAGVIYAPALKEIFCAEKNGGAFLNNSPIKVSLTSELRESLIATGFPYYEFQQTRAYLDLLGELMKTTHGLRRLGSAAIDLAYTACGRFDGFYETGLNAWDVAAGALLVAEAGGVVSDFHQKENHLFGKQIVAANPTVYRQLQPLTQSYLG